MKSSLPYQYKKLSKDLRIYRKIMLLSLIALILVLLIFYVKGGSAANEMSEKKCIFCEISNGRMPETKLLVENDEFVIFKDIKPASKYHFLAVPKTHYESLKVLNQTHEELVRRMHAGLQRFIEAQELDTSDALYGFHLPPFITVKHLHMHAIVPRSEMNFLSRWIFRPSTSWFKTPEEALAYLEHKEL